MGVKYLVLHISLWWRKLELNKGDLGLLHSSSRAHRVVIQAESINELGIV